MLFRSVPSHDSAPYVAAYVNSFVALPDFYTQMPKVVRPKSFHSIGFTESNLFPRKVRIAEVDKVADKCLNGVVIERNGKFCTNKPSWPYILRLFPRFSDTVRKSPSNVYQLLFAAFTAPSRVVRSGCADLSCDPFYRDWETDRKSTRLNSSHSAKSRMPSSA